MRKTRLKWLKPVDSQQFYAFLFMKITPAVHRLVVFANFITVELIVSELTAIVDHLYTIVGFFDVNVFFLNFKWLDS